MLIKHYQPISINFMQFKLILNTKNYPAYFHRFALPYQLTAEYSALPLLTVSPPYPLHTTLSVLFSSYSAP
jgi:hypothetical protein